MKLPLFSPLLALSLMLLVPSLALADDKVDLQNPGFEDQLANWTVSTQDNGMSRVTTEAARNGQYGLRVEDKSDDLGSSLFSAPISVEAGQKFSLSFWSRNVEGEGLAVYLIFYNAKNQALNNQHEGNENLVVLKKNTDWNAYNLEATAPENAQSVKVWIHSFTKAKVTAEVDDFSLVKVTK